MEKCSYVLFTLLETMSHVSEAQKFKLSPTNEVNLKQVLQNKKNQSEC